MKSNQYQSRFGSCVCFMDSETVHRPYHSTKAHGQMRSFPHSSAAFVPAIRERVERQVGLPRSK
jgi:hypothetical protein